MQLRSSMVVLALAGGGGCEHCRCDFVFVLARPVRTSRGTTYIAR
jgi:hypothetical protein